MNRTVKLALGGAVLALGGFAVGRFGGSPRVEERVEYRDRVEYRERVVEKRVEGPVREKTVTREVPGPQGPERIVIHEVERGPTTTETKTEGQGSSETAGKSQLVKAPAPRWMLGVSADARLSEVLKAPAPVLGGEVKYRVAGPFWLGVGGNARGDVRATLSVSF